MNKIDDLIYLLAGMLTIKFVFDTFIAPRYSWENTLKRLIEVKEDPSKQVKMNREKLLMFLLPLFLVIVGDVCFYLFYKVEVSKILILYPKVIEIPSLVFMTYMLSKDIREYKNKSELETIPAIRKYYGI